MLELGENVPKWRKDFVSRIVFVRLVIFLGTKFLLLSNVSFSMLDIVAHQWSICSKIRLLRVFSTEGMNSENEYIL